MHAYQESQAKHQPPAWLNKEHGTPGQTQTEKWSLQRVEERTSSLRGIQRNCPSSQESSRKAKAVIELNLARDMMLDEASTQEKASIGTSVVKGPLSQRRPRTQTRLRDLLTSLSWCSPASAPDTLPTPWRQTGVLGEWRTAHCSTRSDLNWFHLRNLKDMSPWNLMKYP